LTRVPGDRYDTDGWVWSTNVTSRVAVIARWTPCTSRASGRPASPCCPREPCPQAERQIGRDEVVQRIVGDRAEPRVVEVVVGEHHSDLIAAV